MTDESIEVPRTVLEELRVHVAWSRRPADERLKMLETVDELLGGDPYPCLQIGPSLDG